MRNDGMTIEDMLTLSGFHLAPYIQIATCLVGKTRYGGGNMFRHQIDTMAVLIDYGYIDSILLKAALIHDVFEDIPDFNHNVLLRIDYESHAVYELVKEVTRDVVEPKSDFLARIMETGSRNSKVLKVADRISNMVSLGFVNDMEFVKRYTEETERHVFPIAELVNKSMLKELQSLVESRLRHVDYFAKMRAEKVYADSADFL